MRALAGRGSTGEALPTVFRSLEAAGFHFRRGQVTLIAGPPGGGKSALSLALTIALGVGTIYASADSDEFTQGTRAAAMLSGHLLDDVVAAFESGHGAFYEEELAKLDAVRFEFMPDPSIDDMDELVWAFALVYGEYPALIVVDNLTDLYAGEAGEGGGHTGEDKALKYLKSLARATGACVIVLHHLIGSKENGDQPAGLGDLKGKVGKIPESVLTLFRTGRPDDELMGVSIVKNRGGKAAPDGSMQVLLRWRPSRMLVQ